MRIAGIDYGSKLAGTTAIAFYDGDRITTLQSAKKKDADQFLQEVVKEYALDTLFIDAPLSLPKAYFGEGEDFFYRRCDRELKAMSPMFLGGLTARAIKLQTQWGKMGITCFETYPAETARRSGLVDVDYKGDLKSIPAVLAKLRASFGQELPEVTNWHAVDSLLALRVARKFELDQHEVLGDSEEGLIYL